jgi:hypothetical protein
MKPLPARDLFNLKPGDTFVVYWAKDNDKSYVRLDHEVQEVAEIVGDTLYVTDPDYEWSRSEIVDPDRNELDIDRRIAYFYAP